MNQNIITPSTKLVSMSSSKLQDLDCLRLYFWHWVLNLTPKKMNIPLWFGSVMHVGFALMMKHKSLKSIHKAMEKESRTYIKKYPLVSEDESEIQLQLKIAKIIIKVYRKHCKIMIPEDKKIYTETHFELPLEQAPVIYEGTMDSYWKQSKNKIILLENKTAKTINDFLFMRLKLDTQINGYAQYIKIKHGKYPARCNYTAYRKPQIRVTKNETVKKFLVRLEKDLIERKDWYFVTYPHKFGKRSVSEVMRDIEEQVLMLWLHYAALSEEETLNPYNWPRRKSRCLTYGICPYFNLCKNTKKYNLYLRMFQQRELRYENEKKELLGYKEPKKKNRLKVVKKKRRIT